MSLQGKTVAFVGAGVMCEAMIKGLLQTHLTADQIIASDPHAQRGEELKQRYGLRFTLDNGACVKDADIVVLSVKPQVMDKVLPDIKTQLRDDVLIVSIAAGYRINKIAAGTGCQNIVRAMPNTPGQIGAGITVWTATSSVNGDQRNWTNDILGAMGETLFVSEERFLDMATALNGSGPSYVFLLMEALIDAGVHMGFSRQDSQKLVQQTVLGSVQYAIESGLHPAELRNQVTSPGGTSAAALYQLDKGGVRTVISKAVWAAYNRSVELGGDD
ncbi:MAG: pyrroline-5-carboxylate reductase [Aggregatilineales bacterium]